MTAISVSERLLEMAAFYTPLALTVTRHLHESADRRVPGTLHEVTKKQLRSLSQGTGAVWRELLLFL